jgi:hypothetical protein
MKKTSRTGKSQLVLQRELIGLTPSDLQRVICGEANPLDVRLSVMEAASSDIGETMKKTIRANKPALTLTREHIRLLTPTDLVQVVGGDVPTKSDPCTNQSTKFADTCG